MDLVRLELENCYGIRKLTHTFDFTQQSVFAIYAPNGFMKSSLAQTFFDISKDVRSRDRIYPDRITKRDVLDEDYNAILGSEVFVVSPYDKDFEHSERTSVLLVDASLKQQYDSLLLGIQRCKQTLIDAIKKQSKSKKDLEREITDAFLAVDFEQAMTRIESELTEQEDAPFADILYDKVFDPAAVEFLSQVDVQAAIADYIARYSELLEKSLYFKRGTFEYYGAAQIASALAKHGFFKAQHTVNLNADERREISTEKELEEIIVAEKDAIMQDRELRSRFDNLEKQLARNEAMRGFQAYLLDNEFILPELSNIAIFRQKLLKSYLKKCFQMYVALVREYESAKARRKEIEEQAIAQQTRWQQVIDIFNARFKVPFKLETKNLTGLVLGKDQRIMLGFTYDDGTDQKPIDKEPLLEALSTGERKALYVLNIIFEVETRREMEQKTLIVVDDIADSFDYQNKYAIIQYLRDIHQNPLFKLLILTHNFDFFRTLESRFVKYSHCLMATRHSGEIRLSRATGIRNPFINDWKDKFDTDPIKKIASIPFMRNIVEYTRGEGDPVFQQLTSLLHIKPGSGAVTVADLDATFNGLFNKSVTSQNGSKPVVDLIHEQAQECLAAADGVNFENKIVLAIAIRLCSESYMIGKINDATEVNKIDSHQTSALLELFKERKLGDAETVATLERVVLMTPENIHLNSFMYEPIVDMSDEQLRSLYRDCMGLK